MKVICIYDKNSEGKILQIKVGDIYTASQCPVYPDNYDLVEVPIYNGRPISYNKRLFIPLSDIDETELIKERELLTISN